MSLDRVRRLIRLERFEAAGRALDAVLSREDLGQADRWKARLLGAQQSMQIIKDEPVDRSILTLEDLLRQGRPPGVDPARDLPLAHAALIRAYTSKRCRDLAHEAIVAARAAVGASEDVLLAEGDWALEFDDRQAALRRYEEARESAPDSCWPRMALANLRYVLGDFESCQALLASISERDDCWARSVRQRAAASAAVHDHAAEVERWRAVVAGLPDGDFLTHDLVSLALAYAFDDRRDRALETFRRAWRHDPSSPEGGYARDRIGYLERASDGSARKRLSAFPSTQQKWNYCGPAVLELCLRYLEIDLGQDEIARAVKRTTGTPMFEIVQYLRRRGVAARRVEATPRRLRAAVDLGLPVIVQEEYSTTSHVAVITGYDESLGLFIASDPTTHRQSLRPFAWTEQAGDLFGNGGLIVLGRDGAATEALAARADEAGLTEARHLTIIDRCDRQRPRPGGGAVEDAALEQVIQLCQDALALEPDFKLAWHRRWYAENQLYQLTGRQQLGGAVLDHLHQIRTRFSRDEWPHQLHGHWLMDNGRFEEAFVAYFDASRRDPADANNLQAMGECKWLAGDLAAAERYMLQALSREPYHLRAAENLAGVYLRQLEHIEQPVAAGDAEDPIRALTTMAPSKVRRSMERGADDILLRAAHFSRVACSLAPENPFNHETSASLLWRQGDLEACRAAYGRSREIMRERTHSLYGLARVLEATGQQEAARLTLQEGCELFWREPLSWIALADFIERQGDTAGAAAQLERGLSTLITGHGRLIQRYYLLLKEVETADAAAARVRQFAEQRLADEELLRRVAYLLDEQGQRGHALALLRHVVSISPSDINALFRLGELLSESTLTRAEGQEMLERVVALAPDAALPRRQLAWLLLEPDARAGLALLDPVAGLEDPLVHETRSALLAAVGDLEGAAGAREMALESHGDPGPALVDLCAWHLSCDRYDRALDLARQFSEHPLPASLQETADYYWLQAVRTAGAAGQELPRIKALCEGGVPPDLAWEVYWSCRPHDHALAAAAAQQQAARSADPADALRWRIKAATERSHLGDKEPLAQIRQEIGEQASAWAELSWALADLGRHDEANQAAARAFDLDETDRRSLSVMEEAHVRQGQPDRALECARRLCELYPHEHQGPERLGILLSKMFRTEEALASSLQAVDAAPFCHVALSSRALALFVDGQFEEAARHARQSLAINAPEDESGADARMVLCAIGGDLNQLERSLEELGGHEPPGVFARFKDHLLQVARARQEEG